MDCCKTWFAFLSADVIQRCIERSEAECPACTDELMSPLLHFHNQYSLREKLNQYYYRSVLEMDIADLFDRFVMQIGWFTLDREEFISIGQSFVRFSNPDAIFYGKYITKENDFALYGSTADQPSTKVPKKPIKARKRKKNAISQDDVPGTSAEN